jgi:hypothetical protein
VAEVGDDFVFPSVLAFAGPSSFVTIASTARKFPVVPESEIAVSNAMLSTAGGASLLNHCFQLLRNVRIIVSDDRETLAEFFFT